MPPNGLTRTGRPLTLTPDLADAIAIDVANGVSVEHAAEARGVPRATVYRWLEVAQAGGEVWNVWDASEPTNPDTAQILASFLEKITRARAAYGAELERRMRELAENGTREDIVRLKATQAILERHPRYRELWGQHITVSGTVQQQVLVQQLPPLSLEDARALRDRLRARALPPPTELEAPDTGA